MGFIQTEERKRLEMDELKRMLVASAGLFLTCTKDEDEDDDRHLKGGRRILSDEIDDDVEKLVSVTSGVSFLGLAIVNRLLRRGYSVRIIVHCQEDIEKLRELETSGEMRSSSSNIKAVMANLTEVESLVDAFQGCRGVFHTSAFTDPVGLSGYTKTMAEIEVKASENVMKACSRTPSVRNCVITSSLLTCIWRDGTFHELSPVVNHDSWSDESLCMDKKLWCALGKLRAEKAAWRIAKEKGLKLATICPGLITGPQFLHRNPTATLAYLKGAQKMFADGLLATVDVMRLAEAHACVFEAMKKTASGRYICFDRVVKNEDEVERLAQQIGLPATKICGNASYYIPAQFELSDKKLSNLMSRTLRHCYNQS